MFIYLYVINEYMNGRLILDMNNMHRIHMTPEMPLCHQPSLTTWGLTRCGGMLSSRWGLMIGFEKTFKNLRPCEECLLSESFQFLPTLLHWTAFAIPSILGMSFQPVGPMDHQIYLHQVCRSDVDDSSSFSGILKWMRSGFLFFTIYFPIKNHQSSRIWRTN